MSSGVGGTNHKYGDISDIAIFQTVSCPQDFAIFQTVSKDFSSSSLGWTWQPRARKVNGVCWRRGCNFARILEFKLGKDDHLDDGVSGDRYITRQCVFVCNEKSSLP